MEAKHFVVVVVVVVVFSVCMWNAVFSMRDIYICIVTCRQQHRIYVRPD